MKLLEQLLNMFMFARTDATGMLDDAGDEALLAEEYGRKVAEYQKMSNVAKVKAAFGSGNPAFGSMVFHRFQNAAVQTEGTARTALAGNAVLDDQVVVNLSTKKEIVEELHKRDVAQLGFTGLISQRTTNHAARMRADLDRAALAAAKTAAGTAGNDADITWANGTTADYLDLLEQTIQKVETVSNDYVDGVDRSQIVVFLRPAIFGKVRKELDTVYVFNGTTEAQEISGYHGAIVVSEHYLPADTDFIVTTIGNIAQPVYSDGYTGGDRVPLSNYVELSMFYTYGTAILAPDLVFEGEYTEAAGL